MAKEKLLHCLALSPSHHAEQLLSVSKIMILLEQRGTFADSVGLLQQFRISVPSAVCVIGFANFPPPEKSAEANQAADCILTP